MNFTKRLKSFYYASKGIIHELKHEPNFVIEFVVGLLVIFFGILLKISTIEWLFCILLIGFVLSMEIINTSIEKMIDFICPQFDKKVGIIKDLAAGAVFLSAITSAIIGLIIFIPKIFGVVISLFFS